MPEIPQELKFECCGHSRLCVLRMQRRFGFVLNPCLVSYFLCSNGIFHLMVSPRRHFFAVVHHTKSFSSAYPSSRWNYSCHSPLRPLCIPRALRTRKITLCAKVFLKSWSSSLQGLPLYSIGPSIHAHLRRPCWIYQMLQITKWWSVDNSASFWHERLTLIGTMQLKLYSNQWVVIGQTNLCSRCTRANICCKKVFMMYRA